MFDQDGPRPSKTGRTAKGGGKGPTYFDLKSSRSEIKDLGAPLLHSSSVLRSLTLHMRSGFWPPVSLSLFFVCRTRWANPPLPYTQKYVFLQALSSVNGKEKGRHRNALMVALGAKVHLDTGPCSQKQRNRVKFPLSILQAKKKIKVPLKIQMAVSASR